MDDLKKQAFTKRIANANKIQMIEILYEITITYLEDALKENFENNLQKAGNCLDELINSVNIENKTGKDILSVYYFLKKELQIALVKKDKEKIKNAIYILSIFKTTYESISPDNLKPVMQNTEDIYFGLTYNNNLKLNTQSKNLNRGLKI